MQPKKPWDSILEWLSGLIGVDTPDEVFIPTHLLVIGMIGLIAIVVPFWKITSKAGFPGWLSVLSIVPLINIVFLFFLAFAQWPALTAKTELPAHSDKEAQS